MKEKQEEPKGPVVTPGPVTSAESAAKVEPVALPSPEDPVALMGSLIEKLMHLTKQVEVLTADNQKLRRELGTQDPSAYRRKIEPSIVLPVRQDAPSMGEGAVFRSPYPGFKQVLKRSKVEHFPDGERSITPTIMAEFNRGVCVLYDKELIEIMRAKFEEKYKTGIVEFVEIKDEEQKIAALGGTRSVPGTVTIDTPLAEVMR